MKIIENTDTKPDVARWFELRRQHGEYLAGDRAAWELIEWFEKHPGRFAWDPEAQDGPGEAAVLVRTALVWAEHYPWVVAGERLSDELSAGAGGFSWAPHVSVAAGGTVIFEPPVSGADHQYSAISWSRDDGGDWAADAGTTVVVGWSDGAEGWTPVDVLVLEPQQRLGELSPEESSHSPLVELADHLVGTLRHSDVAVRVFCGDNPGHQIYVSA